MQSGAHNSNSLPGGTLEARDSRQIRESFNVPRAFAFSSRSSVTSGRDAHSTSTPRKLLKMLNGGRPRAELPGAFSFAQFVSVTPRTRRRSRPIPVTQLARLITNIRPWAL